MKKRPVEVYALELASWDPPFAGISVHCSSGTYIRSLARDIALAAGSRAHLSALLRTRVAGFRIEDAFAPGSGESFLLPRPLDRATFVALGMPCLEADPEQARKIALGKPLRETIGATALDRLDSGSPDARSFAVFSGDSLLAVIERDGETAPWKYGHVYSC